MLFGFFVCLFLLFFHEIVNFMRAGFLSILFITESLMPIYYIILFITVYLLNKYVLHKWILETWNLMKNLALGSLCSWLIL